jgi:hypothetical protein
MVLRDLVLNSVVIPFVGEELEIKKVAFHVGWVDIKHVVLD